jgi:hypothetical protein
MSASLRASVEKLKQSTATLNRITDEAAQVVQAMEVFLNKECSVGIETYVKVSSVCLDEHGQFEELTQLGYARWAGKFRILVSVGIDPEQQTTKPWSEWDRTTKLETVKKLPDLLEKISIEVDAHVTAAQTATATVAEVLKTIDRKGGK